MDFLEICQALGLALAAGLIIGAVVPPVMPAWGAIAGAVPLGIVACALTLDGAGEPVWPALPIGLVGAALAAVVSRDVTSGAARRAQGYATPVRAGERTPAGVTTIVVLAAVVLAALSLLVPPVSLAAAAALAWIWLNRRRREQQKHEGLRVLR